MNSQFCPYFEPDEPEGKPDRLWPIMAVLLVVGFTIGFLIGSI